MSTLNQAFIKAYQRRGVGAPHIPMPAAPAAVVAAPNLAPPPAPAEMAPANDDRMAVTTPSLLVKQTGAVTRIDVGQRGAEGRASSAVVSGSTIAELPGHRLDSAPAVDE